MATTTPGSKNSVFQRKRVSLFAFILQKKVFVAKQSGFIDPGLVADIWWTDHKNDNCKT